jgi:CheY-like chemotaxis protein
MNRFGPVLLIEDDLDDQEIFQEAFQSLGFPNELLLFRDGYEAIKHLQLTDIAPFLIISDINMPKINGLEFRDLVRKDGTLKFKGTPYVFLTTTSSEQSVIEAYGMSVQGFFIKGNSYADIKNTLEVIMKYWTNCVSPANYLSSRKSKAEILVL